MAKKILSLAVALFMLAALVPMSAFAKEAPETVPAAVRDEPEAEPAWDFEEDPAEAGWIFNDIDEDGYGWVWMTDPVECEPHGGEGVLMSYSYDNDSFEALEPDNWAVTPAVKPLADGTVSIKLWYNGLDPSYAGEKFTVYAGIGTDPVDMFALTEEITATAEYQELTAELPPFLSTGVKVYFAIRHYGSSDQFALQIDDVMIEGAELCGEKTPIDHIEILDFVYPAWGEAPDYGFHAPDDCGYSVSTARWNWTPTDGGTGGSMGEGDLFDHEDYGYAALIGVSPDEEHEFVTPITVSINGEEFEPSVGSISPVNGSYIMLTPLYTVTPPEHTALDEALNVEGGDLYFVNDGTHPWIVVEEGERVYARSDIAGLPSTATEISTTVNAEEGDIVRFEFKARGEGSSTAWDYCAFYIDGVQQFKYGAHDDVWEVFTAELTPGEHTLTWRYSKDSSVNPSGDFFAVDNVYVGQVVNAESIEVEDAVVGVGRHANLVYTVLPEAAIDKSVSFEIADESVATIDENGVITGVAIGETTVTVTSTAVEGVSGTASVTVEEAPPAVTLYGIATQDFGYEIGIDWISFTDAEPGVVTDIAAAPVPELYAAAYANNVVCGIDTQGSLVIMPFTNLANKIVVSENVIGSEYRMTSMAFDPVSNTFYGILSGIYYDEPTRDLVSISMAGDSVTQIASLPIDAYGLAISAEGEAYIIDNYGDLYTVDLETGALSLVGSTGVPCEALQDICYDDNTGKIYWAQVYTSSVNGLYVVDPETAEAEYLGKIGPSGIEVVGLFTVFTPETELITEATILGASVPAPGDTVADHMDITVPEDANYSVRQFVWINEDSSSMGEDDVFAAGSSYKLFVILAADEGFSFAEDCVFTFDGGELEVDPDDTFIYTSEGVGLANIFSLPFEVESSVEPTEPPALNELDAALNVEGGTIHFENGTAYPWTVVNQNDADHPDYAMSGNYNVANSTSALEAHVTIGEGGGTITFDFMACGESSNYGTIFDHCYFSIDGTNVLNRGAEADQGWQTFTYELSPGEHTLRWYYVKDGSVNSAEDCFKLDNVAITGESEPEPTPTPTPGPIPVDPELLDEALNVEGGTIHFENDAAYPWTVVETEDRLYAVSGNAGVHNSTSSITATVTVEGEGMMIRFDLIARGEGYDQTDWDTCRFFVDGEMVMKYGSHDEVWESFEYALEPGEHELMWQYKKDHSTHPDGDYFAVDNVEIVEGTPFVPEEITQIAITGFSAPVWGQHPDYEVEVPEDAHYSVREVMWYYANPDDEDYGTLLPEEYFDSEYCTYEMIVRLDADEGYVFADTVEVTINGLSTIVGSHDMSLFGYYYVYTKEFEVSPDVTEPTAPPAEPVGPYWDFETDPVAQGWTFVDQDGDGFNWVWMLDWYNEYTFHEGDGFMMSLSFDNESGTALTPDNWAITPEFVVPEDGIISFWAQGQDPDWPYEIFGVYLKVAGEDGEWIQLGDDEMTWYADLQYQYDISDYVGETVQVAIRHYLITDMFQLNVDFVEVTSGTIEPPPELIEIHEVYVNGYESPVAGEYSGDHLDLSVPEDANYYICSDEFEAPGWWDNDPDYDGPFDGIFVLGNPYSVGMTVMAEDGYCFADDCVFYVNGETELADPAWTYVDYDDNTMCYVWTVPEEAIEGEPGEELIHDVYVYGFEAPVAGELALDHVNLTVPEDAHYYIIYCGWLDETDQQQLWHDDDVFIAGHVYSEGCQIWADDGFSFAEDCVFHIEGAELDPEWSYVDPDIDWICYINTVPVVCEGSVGELWGDANGDGQIDLADALLIMRWAQGLVPDDEIDLYLSDVNGDGEVNFVDALLVMRFALGLIPNLPM